jgi:hypothetical protein
MKYISPMQQLAVVPFEEDAGIGQDSQTIRRYLEDLLADYYKPLSMLSSVTEIVMHPSYQQIIGMGPTAIPLIFLSMRREHDHWFWALSAITGENPVHIEHRGKIKEMTDAWLDWGQKHLYLE